MSVGFLKNNKGSSIVSVLLFSIIGVGVILGLTPRLLNLSGSYKQTSLRLNYIQFIGNLRATLRDPFSCRLALGNQTLGGPAFGSVNSSLVIGAGASGFLGGPNIQAGYKTRFDEFEIVQARLITTQPNTLIPRIINLDKPSPALTAYRVRINFDVREVLGKSIRLNTLDPDNRFPEYHIDLVANIDPLTGGIYSCHGQDSLAEACEMAGGAFDASPDMDAFPRLRCHPNTRCWVDDIGVRSTAAPPLPMAATPPICPWPYTTVNWIGRVDSQDLWNCQWCNNKLWTPGVN